MKQLSRIVFFFVIVLIQSTAFSQSTCDEIKKENEYLRKALKITTPAKTVTSLNIDFNLIKAEGNKKEQTVTLTLTILNHDANQDVQFSDAKAIDVEGNEYSTSDIHIGSAGSRNKTYTDTPVKTTIRFEKVLSSTQIFKLIPVNYYHEKKSGSVSFEYKDISIDWK